MAKKHYRVRNWSYYNESLVQRGSVAIWFDNESLNQWYEIRAPEGRGRPQVYSDAAIICGFSKKGCAQWKKDEQYHRRSLAETAMFRFEQLLERHLNTRCFENQLTEIIVKANILDRITCLGML